MVSFVLHFFILSFINFVHKIVLRSTTAVASWRIETNMWYLKGTNLKKSELTLIFILPVSFHLPPHRLQSKFLSISLRPIYLKFHVRKFRDVWNFLLLMSHFAELTADVKCKRTSHANQRESCLSSAPFSAGKFAISIPAKPRLSGQTEKGLSASNVGGSQWD